MPVLLDTHVLVWLLEVAPLTDAALEEIRRAQAAKSFYVSPITAWEAGVAILKQDKARRPNLLGLSAEVWFRRGARSIGAKTIPIGNSIAFEAARVPATYGWGDPGDCFLIATAHLGGLTLITRDARILEFSLQNPAYLQTIEC